MGNDIKYCSKTCMYLQVAFSARVKTFPVHSIVLESLNSKTWFGFIGNVEFGCF